jgi:hypothetical protein
MRSQEAMRACRDDARKVSKVKCDGELEEDWAILIGRSLWSRGRGCFPKQGKIAAA